MGKTTVSASYAVREAMRHPRKKVLLISTDPAHSLADVLASKLSTKPTRVKLPKAGNLHVWQIDAEAQFQRFIQPYRKVMLDLLENGTIFSRAEIEPLLDTTMPGMAEISGLLAIHELLQAGEYDRIVVDTAPIGHTLRLFELPQHFREFLDFLELAGSRDQWLAQRFGGSGRISSSFIAEWNGMAQQLTDALTGETSELVLVTSAEIFSLHESIRAHAQLKDSGLKVRSIVLNRVVSEKSKCKRCGPRAARTRQALAFLKKNFSRVPVLMASDPGRPIMGVRMLAQFAEHVFAGKKLRVEAGAGRAPKLRLQEIAWPAVKASLSFTLGKGGVGKTTISAALAFHERSEHPRQGVTVCSTDPAPSLDDVFLADIGARPIAVLGDKRFRALEIDSTAEFRAWAGSMKDKIGSALSGSSSSGVHVDLSFDRQIFAALLDIVPPGVDEIFAIFRILDLLNEALLAERKATVIIDMAPTGHALELLRTPERMLQWTRLLLKTLAAHRTLPLAQDAAVEIATLGQRLRELSRRLQDAKSTRVFCVMLPEPLAVRETERLLGSLDEMKVPARGLFINRVSPALLENKRETCPRCFQAMRWQAAQLAALARRYDKDSTYLVEDFGDQVAGRKALSAFTQRLWQFA